MARIRGYLIDVDNGIQGEHTIDDELYTYYKMLDCRCINIQRRKIEGVEYEIVCDDEVIFKDSPKASACDKNLRTMFLGNIFIAGMAEEGELTSLSEEDILRISRNVINLSNPVLLGVEY